ncbi:P-loop containing nucleoside triphosphate hydrolase protein [Lentithecium fluviatile CBS 122367]|uniref:P-loop containing nucleoside triphosphate hydrolase protein n=1 Tax=Lentithecium fluviatile CBS 122367 TaxID=1168545 RepID=A0A6G1IL15_9PLEO|nr:P-loop containing nucleoside triphosphate hydrolase protein [Lentithecium fluviatile CBS 122367]
MAIQRISCIRKELGVTFRNLHVYGLLRENDYCHTVATAPLVVFQLVKRLFGRDRGQKVHILQELDGVVRREQMLVLLGRPGSGCSTLLRTLSRDTEGLFIGSEWTITYQHPECAIIFVTPARTHLAGSEASASAAIGAFNLTSTADTKIGNEAIRRVSGGQKKRITIAETLSGSASLQCWENSTRGMDSETALVIIRHLRNLSKHSGTTIVISLYQASQRALDEFDLVTVLYQGYQIFFGTWIEGLAYFQLLRYQKPTKMTTGGFFTALTNPAEARNMVQEGKKDLLSELRVRLLTDIKAFEEENVSQNAIPEKLLTKGSNTIMSLIVGSIFFNLKPDRESMQKRAILLFFSTLMNGFMSGFEVRLAARYAWYHPFAEAVSAMLCGLPAKLTTTVFYNVVLHFVTNLRREPSSFFVYLLFMLTMLMTMSMFFRGVASMCRTLHQSMVPIGILTLIFVFRYINPVWYGFTAVMVNGVGNFSAANLSRSFRITTKPSHFVQALTPGPGRVFIDGTRYLELVYSFHRGQLWRNYWILLLLMGTLCAAHDISSEYVLAEAPKGEVLVFLRSKLRKGIKPKLDKETSALPIRPDTLSMLRYPTAPMGATSAGKTTFLDALSQRSSTSVLTGSVSVNGEGRRDHFQRRTGCAQQADVHLPTSTVREALQFAAMLRQPSSIPRIDRLSHVEQGLNTEQRKRLIIGVELAAKPEQLLFLDEPTSGLDSHTAWTICMLLKKLASRVLAILCTTHQPSSTLLQTFNRILIIESDGRTVYCGEKWDASPERQQLLKQFEKLTSVPRHDNASPVDQEAKFAATFTNQLRLVANPFSCWKAPGDSQGLQTQLYAIFLFFTSFSSMMQQIIPYFTERRALFEAREGPSKTFSWKAFLLSAIITKAFFQILLSTFAFSLFYYLMGMHLDTHKEGRSEPFTYWVSPLTYLIRGMFAVGVARKSAQCSATELLKLQVPEDMACHEYLSTFMASAGGGNYCPLARTDELLSMLKIEYKDRWFNLGIMVLYIGVNVAATFGVYWAARVPRLTLMVKK